MNQRLKEIVANQGKSRRGGVVKRRGEMDSLIADLVHTRFSDYQFTVSAFARDVGISESFLRELIHDLYMMSPRDFIESVRVEEALKIMSKNPDTDLYRLPLEVGYMSYRTFLEAFKRWTHKTPSGYRDLICKKSK